MKNRYDLSKEEDRNAFNENVIKKSAYHKNARLINNEIQKLQIAIQEVEQKYKAVRKDLKITVRPRKKAALEKTADECRKLKEQIVQEIARQNILLKKSELSVYGENGEAPLFFGAYPQKKDGTFEPIEWDVLEKDGKTIVLISRFILDHGYYHHENEDVHWNESDIRKWLNEEFYNTAFDQYEKAYICEIENANSGSEGYHTEGGPVTHDRVWLLSYDEALMYFSYDSGRIAYATGYAIERGVEEIEETKASYWWLRSNGGNLYNASVVNFNGYVFEYGVYVNSTRRGIRPVITIKI